MIEETPRTKNSRFEEIIDEDQVSNSVSMVQEEQDSNLSMSETPISEVKTSRLFIELLVCSLLIWSLLFIKQSAYESQVIQTIKQVLDQEMQYEPIQDLVKEIEIAVKQIL